MTSTETVPAARPLFDYRAALDAVDVLEHDEASALQAFENPSDWLDLLRAAIRLRRFGGEDAAYALQHAIAEIVPEAQP